MSADLTQILARAAIVLVPMILSLTVHEWAHAMSARLLGDDTAESQGRLTLNPLEHIDPIGTLALPLLLLVTNSGFFFGWAKPVPFNPLRFHRKVTMRTGTMLVAAAGPLSNLVLAVVCTGILAAAFHTGTLAAIPEPFRDLLSQGIFVNVGLFLFNLIPIYPLDGQKVLAGLLSGETAMRFERFNMQFGTMMLLGVVLLSSKFDILWGPFTLLIRGLLTVFQVPLRA